MRKTRNGWIAAAALALAGAGALAAEGVSDAAGERVVNGDFERTDASGTVGWKDVETRYVVRDGAGRNGTRGLAYANDDPQFYTLPGQSIRLEPGKVYDFEVWVRTENLAGGYAAGASVCLEWTGKGKWLGGSYPNPVKGTRDWTCVKGRTPRIPPEADAFTIRPYVRKGVTGKAWFDDVSVREHVPTPVQALASTAYRDVAAAGDVTFRAALNLAEAGATTNDVAFTYVDAAGAAQRVPADAWTRVVTDGFAYDRAALTRPVAALAPGAQTLAVEVRRADGTVAGRREMTFTRAAAPSARAVTFDKLGRALVRGRPFFPLGMYWSSVTTNDLEFYARSPFNCLMPYNAPTSDDLLDLCAAQGLMVVYSVKDIYAGTRRAPQHIRTAADEEAYLADRAARFKDHPALLAWYLNDEMPPAMLPRLVARRKLMEKLDPGHPCWIVVYQHSQILEYFDSFDVIGTDPYPIPQNAARVVTTWTRETAAGTLGCKPVWQVPQAFDWGVYKQNPDERAQCREPTEAELRSMCWQSIANGANGLLLYSFFDLRKPAVREPFEKGWAKCCRVADEIRRLFPVLLSDERAEEPPAAGLAADAGGEPARDVSVRAWWKDGAAWVLVVNGGDAPARPVVRLNGAFRRVAAALGANGELTTPETLALALEPLGVSVLRLAP